MKLTQTHIDSLVRRVLLTLEKKQLVQFNKSKEAVLTKASEIIRGDYAREAEFDKEIMRMLDDIEKQQTDQFERHSMFKMLKRKVAEERGIII